MTTLLRHGLVEPTLTQEPQSARPDPVLWGVVAAMVLWGLLHAALVVSWLSAGSV